jgi:hypothetical protein
LNTAHTTIRPRTFDIPKGATVGELETLLARLAEVSAETRLRLRVASSVEGSILADVWSGIAVGTAARRTACDVVAWGLREFVPTAPFARSPAFLVAVSVASSIFSESSGPIDPGRARKYLASRHAGLVEPESGSTQCLVEFDPDYPTAAVLRGRLSSASSPPGLRSRMFERLVLDFRRRLEIGALRRRIEPQDKGPAGHLGRFMAELHENGAEHGSRGPDGKTRAGTRTMRIKKHVANSKPQLLERCGSFDLLHDYVSATVPEAGGAAIIEASISDFGLGMVEAFLSTPAGRNMNLTGRALLDALIYERLSAKSGDPSAGLGIRKALEAARQMNGFVSLRTGEFWLAASFADGAAGILLEDVADGPHPKVAGTHWQLLWPQP